MAIRGRFQKIDLLRACRVLRATGWLSLAIPLAVLSTLARADEPTTRPVEAPAAPPPGGKLVSLSFPSLKVVSRSVVAYRCEAGRELGVAYINTDNQQSFAIVRLDGRHLVLVNVLAASGARYTADKFVWWTKGDEGNLYDLTQGENAAPIAKNCKAIEQ